MKRFDTIIFYILILLILLILGAYAFFIIYLFGAIWGSLTLFINSFMILHAILD